MKIQVLKFGGTSLCTDKNREAVVSLILDSIQNGFRPVVIVSAMGRKGEPYATDTLLSLANHLVDREFALLATCGETISSVIVSSMLKERNIKALALTGGEAGIYTSCLLKSAKLLFMNPTKIINLLQDGYVPVIAGFQGLSILGDLAVLERGGSDVTAAAVGEYLRAESIQIYTDVPGIMTADPSVVNQAQLITEISYDAALNLALSGAKVIHHEAVVWAKKSNIPMKIISTTEAEKEGTTIISQPRYRTDVNFSITFNQKNVHSSLISIISDPVTNIGLFVEPIRTVLHKHRLDLMHVSVSKGIFMINASYSNIDSLVHDLHEQLLNLHQLKIHV